MDEPSIICGRPFISGPWRHIQYWLHSLLRHSLPLLSHHILSSPQKSWHGQDLGILDHPFKPIVCGDPGVNICHHQLRTRAIHNSVVSVAPAGPLTLAPPTAFHAAWHKTNLGQVIPPILALSVPLLLFSQRLAPLLHSLASPALEMAPFPNGFTGYLCCIAQLFQAILSLGSRIA